MGPQNDVIYTFARTKTYSRKLRLGSADRGSLFSTNQDVSRSTVLAFCSGYIAVLVSPLHICLVLTCTYFNADLTKVYRKLWIPCVGVGAAGLFSFWINQFV
jgi:hypothetical protein